MICRSGIRAFFCGVEGSTGMHPASRQTRSLIPVEVAASTIQRGNHHVEKALDRLRNDGLALRRNGRGTGAGDAVDRRLWAMDEIR